MADDDAPLSALARAPSKKFDDDTPLASLAGAKKDPPAGGGKRGPKPGAPPGPKASPKAPGPAKAPGAPRASVDGKAKAKAAPGAKRKKASSSSSSSSYSSSSSSDSDDAPLKKKKTVSGGAKKAQKSKLLKKKETQENIDDSGGSVKKRDRSTKEEVVAQLLCRWWYADYYVKNDWPPQQEEFYEVELKKQKLKKVSVQEWEWLPDKDTEGNSKVYELSQYRGVFRNSSGDLIDLRPKDTCPCLNTFMKKDLKLLCEMLISAYENQLEDLKNCRYSSEMLKNTLKNAIIKTKDLHGKASQLK